MSEHPGWGGTLPGRSTAALEGALLPDFDGACVASLLPALFSHDSDPPEWLPSSLVAAPQVVLFVVDGLGALQLAGRAGLAPTLAAMEQSILTTVAPSTTATALTSLATGLTPAEHGLLGYRLAARSEVLNVLRWKLGGRDALDELSAERYQPHLPFFGRPVPVVTRAAFAGSGFSEAHLRGAPLVGWSLPSSIAVEVGRLLHSGEPFVYAYYDGLDRIAHERGLGPHYDAELAFVDRLAADLQAVLPKDAALAICADHGEIEVESTPIELHSLEGLEPRLISGEGRFRWLHLQGDRDAGVLALREELGHLAWVLGREELVETGLFGGPLSPEYSARLGEIAVIAREAVSFLDPDDAGDAALIGRHGSLTPSEMLVPLLGCRG